MRPQAAASPRLPRLREDIRLLADGTDSDGAPTWTLHDPVRGSFYSIGFEAFQVLSLWTKANSAAHLASLIEKVHGRRITESEIWEAGHFLEQYQLTSEAPGGWKGLSDFAGKARQSMAGWLLHNYLYVKFPLVRPAAFLKATLPAARILVSPACIAVWFMFVCAGLYLATRQMGDITEGLARQMNLSGALLFAVTLFVMKIFHELGHAYVATALGCHVRSIGIAVMLLAPMLYTDVTDAWRLSDRRKRIAIDLAGVMAELWIAGLAILAWAILPPGDMRDVALVVTTSAVVMTLAINLSPFMRFDGYFVFADLIGVKNLQP